MFDETSTFWTWSKIYNHTKKIYRFFCSSFIVMSTGHNGGWSIIRYWWVTASDYHTIIPPWSFVRLPDSRVTLATENDFRFIPKTGSLREFSRQQWKDGGNEKIKCIVLTWNIIIKCVYIIITVMWKGLNALSNESPQLDCPRTKWIYNNNYNNKTVDRALEMIGVTLKTSLPMQMPIAYTVLVVGHFFQTWPDPTRQAMNKFWSNPTRCSEFYGNQLSSSDVIMQITGTESYTRL